MLRIEVIDSALAFQNLKARWDDLLNKSLPPHIFLSWDWLFCWWKYFGRGKQLHILIAKDQAGTIRAIAPLFITVEKWGLRNLRVVKFLGTHPISSEYLDFICEERYCREASEAFLNCLTTLRGVDLLFFSDLREDSSVLKFAKASDSRIFQIEKGETCPFISFPSDWETFLKSVNRRVREYVKSNWKFFIGEKQAQLKKAGPADYEQVLSELFRLHTARWRAKGKSGSFGLQEKRVFHLEICRRLLEKNQLGLYYLEVDRKIISVLYGFVYQDTYYYYQTGFDRSFENKKPGLLVLYHAIEQSFQTGLKRFDFLRGEEEYKLKWADSENRTYHLLMPLTSKARLALQARKGYLRVKRKLKGLLRKPF